MKTQFPIPTSYVFQYEDDGSQYWFNRDKRVLLGIHHNTDGTMNFTLDYTDENGVGYLDYEAQIAEADTWDDLVAAIKAERHPLVEHFNREWRASLLTE